MAVKQNIGLGSIPNDGTGDGLRVGGQKIEANFTETFNRTDNPVAMRTIGLPSSTFTDSDDPDVIRTGLNALSTQALQNNVMYWAYTSKQTTSSNQNSTIERRYYHLSFKNLTLNANGQVEIGAGTTLTEDNCLIQRAEIVRISIENGVVTGTRNNNVGDISATTIEDAVNAAEPFESVGGIILIRANDGTNDVFYIYEGDEQSIGTGMPATTAGDYALINAASSQPLSPAVSLKHYDDGVGVGSAIEAFNWGANLTVTIGADGIPTIDAQLDTIDGGTA